MESLNKVLVTGSIFSNILTKSTKKKSQGARKRGSDLSDFYAFVSLTKDKESGKETKKIKFHITKELSETTIQNNLGAVDKSSPVLYLFPEGCGVEASLFRKKTKKEKEDEVLTSSDEKDGEFNRIIFSYDPLVENLIKNGLMSEDFIENVENRLLLKLNDITNTEAVSQETRDSLPEGFKIFLIEKEDKSEKEVYQTSNEEDNICEVENELVTESPEEVKSVETDSISGTDLDDLLN